MVQTGDVILVHFLDNQPLGLRFLRQCNGWPLHVTLMPWFSVADEIALQAELARLATRTSQFTTSFGNQIAFNPETDVTLVQDTSGLHQLHLDLLNIATRNGASQRTSNWVGDAYKPHVTHHDGQPIPQTGDALPIYDFSLVRLLADNVCEVVRHFNLGDLG